MQRAARPGHGLVMSGARRSGDAEGFARQARCYRLMRILYPKSAEGLGDATGGGFSAPLPR